MGVSSDKKSFFSDAQLTDRVAGERDRASSDKDHSPRGRVAADFALFSKKFHPLFGDWTSGLLIKDIAIRFCCFSRKK